MCIIIFILSEFKIMIINKKIKKKKKIIWFSTFHCGVELMFSIISETQWNEDKRKKILQQRAKISIVNKS